MIDSQKNNHLYMSSKRGHRIDFLTFGLVVLVVTALMTLGILRYTSYTASMFDLGHMTQAIWSGTQGRPLEFSYRGGTVSRLGLHVELIYFFLVPFYALFPSSITLVVFQAALFGLGALPVYRLASRRIGNIHAARGVTLIYLFYPMAQSAVLYDFHGETLAMPLLLFALEALDRKAWLAYGLWLVLALSCKITVAASVCVLGAFLWITGQRRAGIGTLLAGLIWGVGVFFGIRPLFAVSDGAAQQLTSMGYLQFYFGAFFSDLTYTWLLRLATGIAVFGATLPVVMYALDWTALAFAVVLPILLSSGPGPSFFYANHRYAVIVPFLMAIIVYGLARLSTSHDQKSDHETGSKRTVTWPVVLICAILLTLVLNIGLVNTPWNHWLRGEHSQLGFMSWAYNRTDRDALKDDWLGRNVPDKSPLLVTTMLAPHLANRSVLHIVIPTDNTGPLPPSQLLNDTDYAVLDALLDYVGTGGRDTLVGNVAYDWPSLAAALNRPDFGLVAAQDGLLLLQKRPEDIRDVVWAETRLSQSVDFTPVNGPVETRVEFGDAISWVDATVTHIRDRRYRLEFTWLALDGISEAPHLFAVTEPVGVDHARILHLPTIALHPTTAWKPGELITETFEVELPETLAPGRYPLKVAWYDATHTFAYATDERSRIGEDVSVLEIVVP